MHLCWPESPNNNFIHIYINKKENKGNRDDRNRRDDDGNDG